MRYLILFLILSGCTPRATYVMVPKEAKHCINDCLHRTFNAFGHTSSKSLGGAAASSMAGLSQDKIFDRVLKYCKDFSSCGQCMRKREGYITQPVSRFFCSSTPKGAHED